MKYIETRIMTSVKRDQYFSGNFHKLYGQKYEKVNFQKLVIFLKQPKIGKYVSNKNGRYL